MKTKFIIYRYILFFSFFITLTLNAQEINYYFYQGQKYGSESCFNPVTVIINGGFGIMQISNRSSQLNSVHFDQGLKNVWQNLSHPVREIKRYGVYDFINNELIPHNLKKENGQWFPNYQQHLIGGGMTFRMLLEWYQYHEFKYPRANAILALTAYHLLNEVVENNTYQGNNVDVIADFLIFNPMGVLLFSSEKVCRFFGNTLNMADWSFQPILSLNTGTIENNGQNFSLKYKIPGTKKWSLFYFFGVHGAAGLSYKLTQNNSISFGGGLIAKDLIETKRQNNTRSITTSLKWTGGLFYERNNSLLASLILAGTKGYRLRLNIYPGVFTFAKLSPGLFCAIGKDKEFIAGIHINLLPIGWGAHVN